MPSDPTHPVPNNWTEFQDWAWTTRVRCFHCGAANTAALMGRSCEGFHCISNCFGQGGFRIPKHPFVRPDQARSLAAGLARIPGLAGARRGLGTEPPSWFGVPLTTGGGGDSAIPLEEDAASIAAAIALHEQFAEDSFGEAGTDLKWAIAIILHSLNFVFAVGLPSICCQFQVRRPD